MLATRIANNEAVILRRILDPTKATLSAAAARSILAIELGEEDRQRLRELAAKARAGSLTPEEQTEIETYGRVGSLISILKSNARMSLRRRTRTNGATS